MSTPAPPAEEPQQQPPPSPQTQSTEDALEAAESSIAPVIAALLLAAMLARDSGGGFDKDDLARGALFPVRWAARATRATGRSAVDSMRGILSMALLPLVVARVRVMVSDEYLLGGDGTLTYVDVDDIARRAVDRALDRAADALDRAAEKAEPVDIYDRFDGATGADTRTDTQRRADTFGTATARWLTREAVFDAQAEVGAQLGVTHKRWVSERDDRVRFEHRHLDGKVVPADGLFVTETGSLRYPGDISAPLHLTINCRCSLEWLKR